MILTMTEVRAIDASVRPWCSRFRHSAYRLAKLGLPLQWFFDPEPYVQAWAREAERTGSWRHG